MFRIIAIIAFAFSLAACDMASTVTEGYKQSQAVESALEQSTGVRPQVGFNWNNGRLTSVTVIFRQPYDRKPMSELADLVRAEVGRQFKQTADNILLGFNLGPSTKGTKARLDGMRSDS